ncbi:hypothetical protein ABZZ20_24040 [Streptomyces sp. NPDC006430]|uniref:hypothetical protein n=1 Tax=Streptomyces sp. NPDC006430 TaxID=3154299 RepID=UPI0033BE5703
MKTGKAVRSAVALAFVGAGMTGCSLAAQNATETAKTVTKAADSVETMVAALSSASDSATKAGSAEIKMVMTTPDTGGRPVDLTGTYSWGNGYAMQAEMPAKQVQMEDLVKDGTITMRLVQGAYYYEVDPLPSGEYEGKRWLKIEASALIGEAGAAQLSGPATNPTSGLKMLKWAKGVDKIGKEDVNGKSTVHYKATVPMDKLDKGVEETWKAMGSTGGEVVVDVWVDDKGMPARLTQVTGSTNMSMDFLSFGATKEVSAPPADETADLTEAVKKDSTKQG